jgi:hypothetical protein
MNDDELLEWLIDEAEEALDFEGLLMLYELSWSLRGQDPTLAASQVDQLCRSAYDAILGRHDLRLVYVSWPDKVVVGDASGATPVFEIADDKDTSTPILALVPR